jgi:hypothetical protein
MWWPLSTVAPPGGGEARVAAIERLGDRHRVEDRECLDRVGVVERGARGDVGAAVVPDDGEPPVAERPHERDAIAGHRALRVRLVVGRGSRASTLAVAAQVGADDGVLGREERRDAVPRRVRPRMPAQQEHRRPGAAVADAQHRLADVDPLKGEAIEHPPAHLPRRAAQTAPPRQPVRRRRICGPCCPSAAYASACSDSFRFRNSCAITVSSSRDSWRRLKR